MYTGEQPYRGEHSVAIIAKVSGSQHCPLELPPGSPAGFRVRPAGAAVGASWYAADVAREHVTRCVHAVRPPLSSRGVPVPCGHARRVVLYTSCGCCLPALVCTCRTCLSAAPATRWRHGPRSMRWAGAAVEASTGGPSCYVDVPTIACTPWRPATSALRTGDGIIDRLKPLSPHTSVAPHIGPPPPPPIGCNRSWTCWRPWQRRPRQRPRPPPAAAAWRSCVPVAWGPRTR